MCVCVCMSDSITLSEYYIILKIKKANSSPIYLLDIKIPDIYYVVTETENVFHWTLVVIKFDFG